MDLRPALRLRRLRESRACEADSRFGLVLVGQQQEDGPHHLRLPGPIALLPWVSVANLILERIFAKINFVFSWSNTGKFGFPQPDNREFREIGRKGNENCLALLVGAYGEEGSIEWHDKTHFQRYDVICEDSDSLLKYARAKFRGRQIPA